MRTFGKIFLILIATFALVAEDAAAKRLGGGGNFGRQRQSYSQPYQQQQAAPPQNAAGAPMARQPMRTNGWLGPLAGLAIGGLLGSMFFGHPFQGMQFMDLLVLGALGFGIYYLLRGARRTAATRPTAGYEYAGSAAQPNASPAQFDVPNIGSGLDNHGRPVGSNTDLATPLKANVPTWFDEASFTKAAKTHFIRLQAAWDRGDMKDIQEYTTPQLFAELSMERQSLSGPQHTEVVRLDTEILDIATEGDEVVVSVRYSGEIREEAGGPAQPFAEVWHVQRELNNTKANWYIAGIQQV